MTKEILNFIGLMSRARAIITGTDLVINGVRSKKVKLVVIDGNVSENTLKKIVDKCNYYHVKYIIIDKEFELGSVIGNASRKVIGITDLNFAKALLEKIEKINK